MKKSTIQSTEWVQITDGDEDVYRSLFAGSTDPNSYENNWAFIRQETRLIGARYLNNGLLLTATIKHPDSPFIFVLPHMGLALRSDTAVTGEDVVQIAARLKASTNRRVVLRKLPTDLFVAVMKTGSCLRLHPEAFAFPSDTPEDITPQVIVSTRSTLACEGSRFVKLRNQMNFFRKTNRPRCVTLSPTVVGDVEALIAKWNHDHFDRLWRQTGSSARLGLTVDNTAYTTFTTMFADRIDENQYFSQVVYVGDVAVGFSFAGRISHESAALYSSISLTAYRGASDYLMMQLFERLSSAGITSLNMGGAETPGLFNFKTKFDVAALRPSYDAEVLGPITAVEQERPASSNDSRFDHNCRWQEQFEAARVPARHNCPDSLEGGPNK